MVPDGAAGDDDFHELKPLQLPWRVNEQQRIEYVEQVLPFEAVLGEFTVPSRLSISRYVAGFVDGFSHHFPVIHMPTFSITAVPNAPELVLAILAVGAQYRYETKAGIALYAASRAIIKCRIQRNELPDFHTVPFFHFSHPHTLPPDLPGTTRTILLLSTFSALQSDSTLLQESLSYRALLAYCVRQVGLSELAEEGTAAVYPQNWQSWAKAETHRRTALFAFCFLNLQEAAFGIPPVLHVRELVLLHLPSSCSEWLTDSEAAWLSARRKDTLVDVSFGHALKCVLKEGPADEAVPVLSPSGNYILVHALLQRIALARQLALSSGEMQGHQEQLRRADVEELEAAFDRWRQEWRRAPESVLSVLQTRDSLAFTATALYGLAHIRLHFPYLADAHFQTCDAEVVAKKIWEAPPPRRGPHLLRTLLHTVHALNVPVQLGVAYLARSQALLWSVQHAVAGFECAVFLSKWLCALAEDAESHVISIGLEREITGWVKRVVREASEIELVESAQLSSQRHQLIILAVAVVRLWASIFSASNAAWPFVRLVGEGLERYAELLEEKYSVTMSV
ncbi:uncharacterized protein K452DRAFT_114190 [Aplosporella prunicola CBS 121167]|uniref:Xylanolytic transcriptional activator regulatory domain-containing protein n=1 Tax=Aplosporella prunicola CBS 121167 TaxID=1176127 RepID=A0A6A6AZ79_9PEZI|nr:uncharacterized protein K452DRAFT_114190 [Aplosporella prunicola CBS 121167]KAF2137090.1 hypothetical protein K452DRAFT_114190 [Aplosporella prunicola CBS 121167]